MTKNKVTLLTLVMALALIGIMVLQFVWMRKALFVRNELFDRSVNEALIRSAERLETMSNVLLVHDMVAPPLPPIPTGYINRQNHIDYNMNRVFQQNYVFTHDTVINEVDSKGGQETQRQIKIVTNGICDSDAHQVTIQVEEVDSMLKNIQRKIDHNVKVMYSNTLKNQYSDSSLQRHPPDWERRIGRKVQQLKNVAGKMVLESWAWDDKNLPDTLLMQSLLAEELMKRNIPISYEFALLRADSVLSKSMGYNRSYTSKALYNTPLFPNAIFNNDDLLSIYFPDRNAFLLKTLILPASLSLLFCIIIMGTFGLSIYYIIRQKKVSEMKSDFINNMTHEFKTPLATISVATDSIINPKVIGNPDQINNYASIIRKENQRMNQQIETLLQIASLDRKDFDFRFKLIDIHELIEKAVQGIILQVESRNGYINIEMQASNPMITADPVHALNMLNNLLDNANKYSPEIPQIIVKTRNSDRGVWISVSDHGIGMNKQVQHKIFEKFYRETTGNIHNVKGFGLGLSYVKAVVDANKGEIRVTSEPGKGSTFEVFLPFTLTA